MYTFIKIVITFIRFIVIVIGFISLAIPYIVTLQQIRILIWFSSVEIRFDGLYQSHNNINIIPVPSVKWRMERVVINKKNIFMFVAARFWKAMKII